MLGFEWDARSWMPLGIRMESSWDTWTTINAKMFGSHKIETKPFGGIKPFMGTSNAQLGSVRVVDATNFHRLVD